MGKKILLDFIKNHKISYIVGIFFMLLASYIQSLFPKLLGNIIDILKTDNFAFSVVSNKIVYILLIALGTFLSACIWRNLVIANSRTLECYLREMLYAHFQKLSPEFYNKKKTGDLIAYAINDISAIRMTFGPATALSINGIAICAISIYSMSRSVNWQLTFMALIPIPLIIFSMLKIGKLIQKRFKKVQESFGSISDRVQENIYGIRVIKAYVQEAEEINNFQKLNKEMMDANLNMVKTSSFLSPSIDISFSISFVMSLIVGGNMVLKGSISLGEFIAFNGYLTMIVKPVTSMGRVLTIMERGMASFKRLNDIFNVKPEIEDGEKMLTGPLQGEITFNNLSFSYPTSSEITLENINFNIPKGCTVGILGKTGSGKTTLISLLLKLYNSPEEKIIIDGIDINDFSLEALREGIGYVPQDNFLFSASIKDNISFFKDIYTEDEIKKAAKVSAIYDSIMNLPNNFDTILGERGINLSGGQKQRIALARAIVKNPPILILDDSLSAVDTITEFNILNNLNQIRKEKTTIIIAHRISALKNADFIIVLDKGKILEKGTHHELIKEGGLYYETFKSQFKEEQNECPWEAS